MTNKMKSFVKGILAGLAGKPLEFAEGEPVAYLYNGVRLPKLPEWDKEKYPYAFIYKRYSLVYGAYVCDLVAITEVTYAYQANSDWAVHVGDVDRLGWRVTGDSTGNFPTDEWETLETAWLGYVPPTDITWANFDVLNEDGTVVLKATDPVPVYE